jgi:hypothetical protein
MRNTFLEVLCIATLAEAAAIILFVAAIIVCAP